MDPNYLAYAASENDNIDEDSQSVRKGYPEQKYESIEVVQTEGSVENRKLYDKSTFFTDGEIKPSFTTKNIDAVRTYWASYDKDVKDYPNHKPLYDQFAVNTA